MIELLSIQSFLEHTESVDRSEALIGQVKPKADL